MINLSVEAEGTVGPMGDGSGLSNVELPVTTFILGRGALSPASQAAHLRAEPPRPIRLSRALAPRPCG